MRPARLLIFDPHRVVGGALAAALCAHHDLDVRGVVSDVTGALRAAATCEADVLLVDPESAPGGMDVVSRLRGARPQLRIIIVTDAEDVTLAVAAVRAGATAWIPKRLGVDHLVDVVRTVAGGGSWFPPVLLGEMLRNLVMAQAVPADSALAALTAREREVLECMVDGLDRQAIADRLFLSANTVRTHVQNLLGKLNVHSSLEAVAIAVRAGLTGTAGSRASAARTGPVSST